MNDTAATPPAPGLGDLETEAARLDAGVGTTPPPDAGAAPPPEVSTAEVLRPLLRFTFDFFAPRWRVTDEESSQLAEAYAVVLDKYFPDGLLNRWGAELNAALITFVIFGPRLKIAPRDPPPPAADAAPPVKPETIDPPLKMQ